MVKVSVIIPVYNVRRYLRQCLESVISQTYQNIEILIIDDGSTDGGGRICDQYAMRDARIRVIHTDNRGLAAARNLGLENAGGTFVSFLDSDDWMELRAIEKLVTAAEQTGADIVTAGSCSEYVERSMRRGKRIERRRTYRGQEIMPAFVSGFFGHVAWNKLYRVECFNDIRYPDGHNYEDVCTTWRLMKNLAENGGVVTVLPDVLFHFRVRKSSITHIWSTTNLRDCWMAYHALYEAFPDYQEKLLPGCFIPIGRMWMSYRGYSKEEKADVEEIVREMCDFSKEHFHGVMRGKYSKYMKAVCLLSQSSGAPAMWIGSTGVKLRRALRRKKFVMFE